MDNEQFGSINLNGKIFDIIVVYNESHGEIIGELIKLNDQYYYHIVEDENNEKFLMVFNILGNEILVKTFGNPVGTGSWVTYDGIYKRK